MSVRVSEYMRQTTEYGVCVSFVLINNVCRTLTLVGPVVYGATDCPGSAALTTLRVMCTRERHPEALGAPPTKTLNAQQGQTEGRGSGGAGETNRSDPIPDRISVCPFGVFFLFPVDVLVSRPTVSDVAPF